MWQDMVAVAGHELWQEMEAMAGLDNVAMAGHGSYGRTE